MIELTQAAQNKLVDVLRDKPEYKYVRVGIRGGGCSGFEYTMVLADVCEPDWITIDYPNIKIVVDPISMMYLENVTVDYLETLESSGFKFDNPQMKTSCGCGKSFSV